MKIRTRLNIITVVTFLFSLMIGLVIFLSSHDLKKKGQAHSAIAGLSKSITQLQSLSFEYLMNPHPRILNQWEAKSQELEGHFREIKIEKDRKELFQEILTKYQSVKATFIDLNKAMPEKKKGNSSHLYFRPEILEAFGAQFILKIQDMVFDTFNLLEQIDAEGQKAQNKNVMLVIALVLSLSLLITLIFYFFGNKLKSDIALLSQGTRKVAEGNLDFRVNLHTRDEMGQLAEAFNWMTRQLNESYTSITNLEKEILKRKLAERKIQDQASKWQTTFDAITDSLCLLDLEGRIIQCNLATVRFLGRTREELVGRLCWEVFHGTPGPLLECPIPRLKNSRNRESLVFQVNDRWLQISVDPVVDETGELSGAVHIMEDITERKQAEAEVRRLHQELQEYASRLEQRVSERTAQLEAANQELEAFAYSVSHDLKAPLRTIDGFSKILLEDFEPHLGAEGRRLCSIISTNARNMGKLIEDLLAFSRAGRKELRPKAIDMETLVRSVFDELTAPEEKDRIDLTIDPLPWAQGDPTMIRQVWMNLVGNALKFSSKKERAAIGVGCLPIEDLRLKMADFFGSFPLPSPIENHKSEPVYFIRDNGSGFDMAYAHKLFGVFQRLHSAKEFEGTGVGLAITQRIIQRHGGRIWAEGKVGEGACFFFTLSEKMITAI